LTLTSFVNKEIQNFSCSVREYIIMSIIRDFNSSNRVYRLTDTLEIMVRSDMFNLYKNLDEHEYENRIDEEEEKFKKALKKNILKIVIEGD